MQWMVGKQCNKHCGFKSFLFVNILSRVDIIYIMIEVVHVSYRNQPKIFRRMVVALGRVIQNNADIWAASRPGVWWVVGSLLAPSFGLGPGGEVGREWEGWPGEAIILCGSLDLCCLQLDIGDCPADKSFTAIFSGGKGL